VAGINDDTLPDFPPQKAKPPRHGEKLDPQEAGPRVQARRPNSALAGMGTSTTSYSGLDSPELKRDLAQADAECLAFEQDFKGRLPGLAVGEGAGRALVEVVKRYEARRTGSPADLLSSLVYAATAPNPVRAKFYGDVQERSPRPRSICCSSRSNSTASTMRRFDAAMTDPRSATTGPGSRTCARRSRISRGPVEQLVPREIGDRLFGLEPAYDETIAGLRFKIGGKPLAIELALNLLQDADGKETQRGGASAGQDLQGKSAAFTLITNTLAKDKEISDRWRGFQGCGRGAPFWRTGSSRGGWRRWCRRCARAYPKLSHRYYALKAKMVRQEDLAIWDRNATAAESRAAHDPLERRARHRAHRLWRVLAQDGGSRRSLLQRHWIDAAVREGKQPAPSRIRRCRRRILMCCSTTRASRRDVMTLAHELGHGVHQVAGGAQWPADGADAASRWPKGLGVRRDAHL